MSGKFKVFLTALVLFTVFVSATSAQFGHSSSGDYVANNEYANANGPKLIGSVPDMFGMIGVDYGNCYAGTVTIKNTGKKDVVFDSARIGLTNDLYGNTDKQGRNLGQELENHKNYQRIVLKKWDSITVPFVSPSVNGFRFIKSSGEMTLHFALDKYEKNGDRIEQYSFDATLPALKELKNGKTQSLDITEIRDPKHIK